MALTGKRRKAIEALLVADTVADAAQMSGVALRTLHRWLSSDAEFQSGVRDAEREALAAFSRELVTLAHLAASALRDALQPSQKIGVRVRAAGLVVDKLIALRSMVELEQRLSELEQMIIMDR